METIKLKISELANDPANARKHDQRNVKAIADSLQRFGQQKPIVVDKSKVVRAGNGTLEAARMLGWDEITCVMTSLTGSEATAYAIADNRTAELAEWDDPVLMATLQSLEDEDRELLEACGYTEAELEKLISEAEAGGIVSNTGEAADLKDSPYTNKITAPIYEPKGERPQVSELTDRTKADELIAEINASAIPDQIKKFMKDAAERHVVFNFRSIAEFYCHADKDLQHLMEQSGLIIIDMDKAIANGFVHLSERLGAIADLELSEAEDA